MITIPHTPAPWEMCKRLDGGWNIVRGVFGLEVKICEIDFNEYEPLEGHSLENAENEANARLIAAAPDMLEVLEELITMLDYDYKGHCYRPPFVKGKEIICKARGQ